MERDFFSLVQLWWLKFQCDFSFLEGNGIAQRHPLSCVSLGVDVGLVGPDGPWVAERACNSSASQPRSQVWNDSRGLKPPQLVCFSSSVHLFSKNFLMLCPARPMSELSSLNFSQLSNTRLTSMMNVSKFWYLKNRAKNRLGYCICISLLKDHETALTDMYVLHMMDSAIVLFILMLKWLI